MSYNAHTNTTNTQNLWIGELENWMDEKYISQSLETYSK